MNAVRASSGILIVVVVPEGARRAADARADRMIVPRGLYRDAREEARENCLASAWNLPTLHRAPRRSPPPTLTLPSARPTPRLSTPRTHTPFCAPTTRISFLPRAPGRPPDPSRQHPAPRHSTKSPLVQAWAWPPSALASSSRLGRCHLGRRPLLLPVTCRDARWGSGHLR